VTDRFVHLHTHTSYSLLDGLARIDDLLQSTLDYDTSALALTDHGTMFGAIEFYGKAKEVGVKPIIGCEVYVADAPLEKRPGPESKNYHLVLLAENEVGYRNLIQLTTQAHLRGFYRKPRVDHELLERHSEGLVCLSACASSEVARLILDGNLTGAEERADWYRQVFQDRYFLELQYHDLEFQKTINQGIVHLHQRLGVPLVATNDVHYVTERQAYAHEVLLCVQTQTTMSDPKRMRMESQQFYLKSPEQMHALFGEYPGAVSNTLAIAERCNLELVFGRPHLPKFDTPDGLSSEEFLRRLCEAGLARRYPDVTEEIRARLEYELTVIFGTGFVDYFLLVYDVIRFAREQGIAVGPGRGSAAASIVAYCLFITNIDPVGHGLSFERFLNPERVTMPDMDLDFADDRRDEVIRYVNEKYGRDRVAQIITFGTMGPRAGVRDVGRVLGMPYPDVDRVAKLVPFMCSKVAKAKEEVAELRQLYDSDSGMRSLLDTVEDLEGVARHASTHAAGVVISRDPLVEHVPLYKVPKSDQVTTQYAMASIEKIGLLKLDFLGLRTLTILERARVLIEETTGKPCDLDEIPMDDHSIYELLSSGDTFGIFQVDGAGFRKLMRELRPTEFKHIVAAGALYRPGPMEHIPEFVARKNGVKVVKYDHPALKEVLEETYGIVVYQDQVMRVAALVAGYSMGEADLLRRAMGKKKAAELAKHRSAFIERAGELGTNAQTAEHLFNVIEPFAGYAFNKAHAAAYAVITCQTAYLKANHPTEYMAAYLSAEKENAEKVMEAMAECGRLGIKILPPDINCSDLDFTLEDGGIRFGLSAIKHAGTGAIESLLRARADGGPFSSLEELCTRIDSAAINKRVLESLAKCGALDCIGVERKRLVEGLDRIASFAVQVQRAAASGQVSLFGEASAVAPALQLPYVDPAMLDEKIAWEEELLGTAISRHPIADLAPVLRAANAVPVSEVTDEQDAQRVAAGGVVRRLRSFPTKDGRPMATFQLADLRASIEVVVFSRSYEHIGAKLTEGTTLVIEGKIDASDGRLRLLASDVHSLDDLKVRPLSPSANGKRSSRADAGVSSGIDGSASATPDRPTRRITIELRRGPDRSEDVANVLAVYETLQRYHGQDEVEILVRQGVRSTGIPLPNKSVGYCEKLAAELVRVLEVAVVRVDGEPVSL
jgi:DNA polymerase-3 subunit alpha